MIRKLIEWSLNNSLIVILVSLALAAFGIHAFLSVNVEAYPDPAPPIVEIVATTNGMSAEEVERQVSIPLEVTLAGMPGLKFTRSKSLFGLSHLRIQFEYGTDYLAARQEVINRLQFTQPLPPGVSPQLSPESPTGEIYRYTLDAPKDEYGQDIYTLNDLKALQDWVLERQFRRVVLGHSRRFEENEAIERAIPHPIYDGFGDLIGYDEPDKVQCVVLLRKNEDSLPALKDVEDKVKELNDPDSGRMLPGVKIEPYYDRTDLIGVTTETVRENLFVGMLLVTAILFMFLSNVRTALIVALNIPLALLFAFSMLFARGKSANLLSIGAVDFGIIVDSSVIMVENLYRHLASSDDAEFAIQDRILKAAGEIQRPLLFSTMIMVCAFIPLFTMRGPEGQLFGPMADTYAFALCGALVMAVTLTPVLCLFFLKRMKPAPDNLLVRMMKRSYLSQLNRCLNYRWVTMLVMGGRIVGTGFLLPHIGNEFMPELEEGNLWIRGTSSLNTNLERGAQVSTEARKIMLTYPEVEQVVNQLGRPDDGTDSTGFYNSEYFVPLKPESEWPAMKEQHGIRRWLYGAMWPRTKEELVKSMNDELAAKLPGTDWNFSQNIRDNVMESLSGVKGDNSVKIFGPDLEGLQNLAEDVKRVLEKIDGIENVGIFDIRGQTNLEFRVDPKKCEKWGIMVSDVNNVISSALGGKALTTMIEGEKMFDVSVRWPKWRRASETSILDIPVDIVNNQVVLVQGPGFTPSATGTGLASPSVAGSLTDTRNNISIITPARKIRTLARRASEDFPRWRVGLT